MMILLAKMTTNESGLTAGLIRRATLILDRSGSKRAHLNPLFQSMITGHSHGVVDGLVALEIGLKADDKSAQLVVVVVLDPTEGWSENAENAVVEPALSLSQSELIS